jgi:hypothetical protein
MTWSLLNLSAKYLRLLALSKNFLKDWFREKFQKKWLKLANCTVCQKIKSIDSKKIKLFFQALGNQNKYWLLKDVSAFLTILWILSQKITVTIQPHLEKDK